MNKGDPLEQRQKKYWKKDFENIVTGNETQIYFFNQNESVLTEFLPPKCDTPMTK